ncbi:hypothetical protein L1887_57199 [Cichorium endivia]|nr:hypothetical protein L1887_57199 [Cichorium endivia]
MPACVETVRTVRGSEEMQLDLRLWDGCLHVAGMQVLTGVSVLKAIVTKRLRERDGSREEGGGGCGWLDVVRPLIPAQPPQAFGARGQFRARPLLLG